MIKEFKDEYGFLSNSFYREQKSLVQYVDPDTGDIEDAYEVFPTVEHAFLANKTLNRQAQLDIISSIELEDVRKISSEASVRDNWAMNRDKVMIRLLEDKFEQNLDLKILLLSTIDIELQNGNSNDVYYGIAEDGKGDNMLGIYLSRIRENIYDQEGSWKDVLKRFFIKNNLGLILDKVSF